MLCFLPEVPYKGVPYKKNAYDILY